MWVRNTIALLFGLLGCLLALTMWHLYTDHETFHALVNSIIQQQQKQASDEKKANP